MKKIGIDFTYIEDDSTTGIRKYGEELLDGLSKINNKYDIVLFINESLQKTFEDKFPQYKKVLIRIKNYKHNRYLRIINNLTIAKLYKKIKILKEKCDIIVHPFTDINTPLLGRKNEISTLLDIIPLDIIQDKNSLSYKLKKSIYIKLMNKSRYIITTSVYSKNRLNDINPNYNGEIIIIPSSVEKLKKFNKSIKEIVKNDKPYIFTINSFFKHKNQITLVKAFNIIKNQIPHNLILVGRPEIGLPRSSYQDVVDYIEKEKLNERVKILSHVSDEDKNTLFYNADLFVSTSMQEGFGRTPVEAALCKVPVISTRETSLPEATMDMTYYYINPTDEMELANKILEVLNNRPSKEELEQISTILEEEYNEEKIAKRYMNVIEKIIEKT